jgi:hypothetical protein
LEAGKQLVPYMETIIRGILNTSLV